MSGNKSEHQVAAPLPNKDGLKVLKKSVTQLNNAMRSLKEYSDEYKAFAGSSFIVDNDRAFVAGNLSKCEAANKILQQLKEDAENRVKAAESAKAQTAVTPKTSPVPSMDNNSIIAAAIAAGLAVANGAAAANNNSSATKAKKKTPSKGEEGGAKRTRRVYTPLEDVCFKHFVSKHPTKSAGDVHLFKAFLYTENMTAETRKGLEDLEDSQIKNKLESVRGLK